MLNISDLIVSYVNYNMSEYVEIAVTDDVWELIVSSFSDEIFDNCWDIRVFDLVDVMVKPGGSINIFDLLLSYVKDARAHGVICVDIGVWKTLKSLENFKGNSYLIVGGEDAEAEIRVQRTVNT